MGTRLKFEVRRVLIPLMETERLGYIYANHQPEALGKAFKRWPNKMDGRQVQGGFTLRNMGSSDRK